MGVSADHGIHALGHGVHVELFQVMDHVETIAAEPDRAGDGKALCPGLAIVVAAYGPYGTDGFELFEHVPAADVARVDDRFRAPECSNRLRADLVVGIG